MNEFLGIFTRRTFVLVGLKTFLTTVLISRLLYLQILKGSYYKILSDKNHLQSSLIEPTRGLILDSKGIMLAGHKISYRAYLVPEFTDQPLHALNKIKDVIAIAESDYDILLSKLMKNKRSRLLIREDLTWEELSRIELRAQDFQGIIIEKGEKRYYPFPDDVCHIVGYVGSVSSQEQNENEPLLYLPGFRIGKAGLEKVYNQKLQGAAGIRHQAVDAYGHVKQNLETISPSRGENLHLTIDHHLQHHVLSVLGREKSATAIVMDIHTGAIKALASHPTYNSQLFVQSISKTVWKDLTQNPYNPLLNKAIQGLYSPGSIFKLIVGLAALNENVITPHTTCVCNGHYDLNGHPFYCWNWKQGGHGTMTLESAIEQSCDVFFYQISQRLGVDKIAQYARFFGFGQKTGIDLLSEKNGIVPTKEWKKNVKKNTWTMGDTLNLSIGQGFLLATPMQQVRMVSMLANGLKRIKPHLVVDNVVDNPHDESEYHIEINPEHIQVVLRGMYNVVNSPSGTAYHSRIMDPSCSMSGKTASTQVSRITSQQRLENKHNDRSYEQKEHAMFVALVPAINPRYALSVVVEHGGGGAKVAAPLARDIAHYLQKMDQK